MDSTIRASQGIANIINRFSYIVYLYVSVCSRPTIVDYRLRVCPDADLVQICIDYRVYCRMALILYNYFSLNIVSYQRA